MHPAMLDHFQNPRNVGQLEPPAIVVDVENPICGDMLKLSVALEGDVIVHACFKTRGCAASIAASSALTELLIGRTVSEAKSLRTEEIDAAVGGLAAESKHAAALCIDGVRRLLGEIIARGRRPTG